MRRILWVVSLSCLLCPCATAAPGLMNYQGRLTDNDKQPIVTPTDVTFTFWDQESGGSQLGGGFSDTDTVTPDSGGLFTTLIGDDQTLPVPESIFATDTVWLNLNVGGANLSPRTRITSVGYAIRASSADTAVSVSPALNDPGDRLDLGNNTWFEMGSDGRTHLYVDGRRQGRMQWFSPSNLADSISPGGHDVQYPQAAKDNDGNAIIVWYQSDGSYYQIFKSEYRGGVWTHPSSLSDNISPDGQNAMESQVAMDNHGNAIIVWRQSDGSNTQVFKSEYRGGVWTHPSSLSDNISPNGQNVLDQHVAMDDNGNAIIVWQQSDSSFTQVFKSEYRAGVWTHPSGLTDNISPDGQSASYPQVAMGNNGHAIIAWLRSDGATYQIYKSQYRSNAWTYPSGLGDHINPAGEPTSNPWVAMDNNGDALIVWPQIDGMNYQIFKSECRAGVWTHPSGLADNISPDGQSAQFAQVAMDNIGNAIIAWNQYDSGGDSQIFKSEYRAGAWTHPSGLTDNISPNRQNARSPAVAMGDNGNAIIAWDQSDGLKTQVFKAEYRGGPWTVPENLLDNISPDGQDADYINATMDATGNAILVWRQSDGSTIRIFKSEYTWGL